MELPRAGLPRAVPSGTLLVRHVAYLATQSSLGELEDAAVFVRGNRIEWVGLEKELPESFSSADKVVDLGGCVMVPGR
jgi:cytosine/adenosine deaminase-related metal-dependent hydrolase